MAFTLYLTQVNWKAEKNNGPKSLVTNDFAECSIRRQSRKGGPSWTLTEIQSGGSNKINEAVEKAVHRVACTASSSTHDAMQSLWSILIENHRYQLRQTSLVSNKTAASLTID
jgi:hypothetical protein